MTSKEIENMLNAQMREKINYFTPKEREDYIKRKEEARALEQQY